MLLLICISSTSSLRLNLLHTIQKENIINTHIRPYFGNKSLSSITSIDILQWQNKLLMFRDDNGNGYSQTYLRTVQNQLNVIFNHARGVWMSSDISVKTYNAECDYPITAPSGRVIETPR